MSNPEKQATNIREHLANERTFRALALQRREKFSIFT
jgi:uncharacterized membrane protein YidH (DUF202 family)